jgi:hypothetical protein
MGSAGLVILFVLCTAATGILGLFFVMYAARCLLVIVDQTAAGNSEVVWPDEPMVDWFGQGIHLVWLLLFSFVPAWALAQGLAGAAPETIPWQGAIFLASVWLIFPICLLSNMTGSSRWVVLHARFLRGAAYHFGPMLLFYLLTGILLGGAGFLVFVTLKSPGWELVLLMPVAITAVWFIYARWLGRIAYRIGQHPPPDKAARKKPRREQKHQSRDPWAAPHETGAAAAPDSDREGPTEPVAPAGDTPIVEEEEEDEDDWRVRPKPYQVIFDDSPKDWWERKTHSLDEDPGVYEMSREETAPPAALGQSENAITLQKKAQDESKSTNSPVSEEELERALELRRGKPRKRERLFLAREFFAGIFEFPFYPSSLSAWIFLSFLGVLISVLFRCLQILQPPD